jgi:hypothetical protein
MDVKEIGCKVSPIHAMKAYRVEEVLIRPFLTSALHGGERLTSLTGRFAPGEITWYPLKMRQTGAQSRSGHFEKGKSLLPLSKFETQTVQSS